ncbi:Ubiquitin-conjugating enzyme E2 T [Gracilariopsis chorda]|uniref:E2 ubiquitin-conjugating enzyme n=1 Tax=Gracilariopsis chorda TaxID=448386 RepID=A0A2V3J409_9FLOR|nr:Ubiquitin-conjugating enzyme E2 T [Gracilariopsis chorda]|eukprot:PXF49043.1 Ubiquitin-conjugating enzyme E2 T [Gracilariopsis chorda]
MNTSVANKRIKRELDLLARGSAAPGIAAWARDEASRLDLLDAEICGAADTPYHSGVFRLELHIPREYPFKPPRVRFLTKIYHPNIDTEGRICLDSLNMPPNGAWKPSLNIATVLTTIQALMSTPNADDGLMADITDEYRTTPAVFRRKAEEWTNMYANPRNSHKCSDAANPPQGGQLDQNESHPSDSQQHAAKQLPSLHEQNADHDEDAIEPQPTLGPLNKKQRLR